MNPVEIINQFYEQLQTAGLAPSKISELVPDGKLHRFHVPGDKANSRNGWFVLFLDKIPAGSAGSWRTGQRVDWYYRKAFDSLEKVAHLADVRLAIARAKEAAEAERARRGEDAAKRAARAWAAAHFVDVVGGHPYLKKKRICGADIKILAEQVVLPVTDWEGNLKGLQYISPTGEKRFTCGMSKKGCFIACRGFPDGSRPIWVAEGWATACTLQAMRPEVCCIAALDCGNLQSVAVEARRRWPSLDIVICPDFDAIGRQKGLEAAKQARARILPPPDVVPENCTDWNDWQALQGVSNVR